MARRCVRWDSGFMRLHLCEYHILMGKLHAAHRISCHVASRSLNECLFPETSCSCTGRTKPPRRAYLFAGRQLVFSYSSEMRIFLQKPSLPTTRNTAPLPRRNAFFAQNPYECSVMWTRASGCTTTLCCHRRTRSTNGRSVLCRSRSSGATYSGRVRVHGSGDGNAGGDFEGV